MGLFAKKNIYRVVWKYYSTDKESYTEYVKAKDAAEAWYKIRKQHMSIHCVEVIKVDDYEFEVNAFKH